MVTLTWHACKYKVHKLHQRYILCCCGHVMFFRALINSLMCWFCTGTLGLVLFQLKTLQNKTCWTPQNTRWTEHAKHKINGEDEQDTLTHQTSTLAKWPHQAQDQLNTKRWRLQQQRTDQKTGWGCGGPCRWWWWSPGCAICCPPSTGAGWGCPPQCRGATPRLSSPTPSSRSRPGWTGWCSRFARDPSSTACWGHSQ